MTATSRKIDPLGIAWHLGKESCYQRHPESINPYPSESEQWYAFAAGWDSARIVEFKHWKTVDPERRRWLQMGLTQARLQLVTFSAPAEEFPF